MFVCLAVLCNAVVQVVGMVGLKQKFDIRGPVFEHNSLTFTMEFLVSDFMDDTMVEYTMYDGLNCKDGGDNDITENSGYLLSKLITDGSTTRGDGSGDRTMKVKATLDPTKLVDSSIYHQEDGDNNHATVEFCIRFGVYNTDKDSPNAMEANFLENPVTLNIDFSAGIAMNMEITESSLVQADA